VRLQQLSRLKNKKVSNDLVLLSKMNKKSPDNQIINNSSSQSSLGNFTGIMDLSNKKKTNNTKTTLKAGGERKHETLKIDSQQTSKPLLSKTNSNVVRK
jgi:hypothetical protein